MPSDQEPVGGSHLHPLWMLFDTAMKSLLYISGLLFLFLIVATCYDVVTRTFFRTGLVFLMDLCGYCMVWAVFLGGAWVLREQGHVRIDTVILRLKPKQRAVVKIGTSVVSFVICIIFVYQTSLDVWKAWQSALTLGYPLTVPKTSIIISIPFGFLLLMPYFLRQAWEGMRLLRGL